MGPWPMKAFSGVMDAQDTENTKTNYLVFKVANNNFKIVQRNLLVFGGRFFSPF